MGNLIQYLNIYGFKVYMNIFIDWISERFPNMTKWRECVDIVLNDESLHCIEDFGSCLQICYYPVLDCVISIAGWYALFFMVTLKGRPENCKDQSADDTEGFVLIAFKKCLQILMVWHWHRPTCFVHTPGSVSIYDVYIGDGI